MSPMARYLTTVALLAVCTGATAFAEDPEGALEHMAAMRKLSINHSLLERAEVEYRLLLEREIEEPSPDLSQRITDLRYKIDALREDAARLREDLPEPIAAENFMTELVRRQETVGSPEPVDTASDKRLDERIREITALHEHALSLVAEKRYGDAQRVYEEIVLTSPDDDEAYLLLGHTALADRRYDKAGRAFANAVHIDPGNAREMTRLYENILLENPSDDEAMTQLGYIYVFLGDGQEAMIHFEDALRANPANEEARLALSKLQVVSEPR